MSCGSLKPATGNGGARPTSSLALVDIVPGRREEFCHASCTKRLGACEVYNGLRSVVGAAYAYEVEAMCWCCCCPASSCMYSCVLADSREVKPHCVPMMTLCCDGGDTFCLEWFLPNGARLPLIVGHRCLSHINLNLVVCQGHGIRHPV